MMDEKDQTDAHLRIADFYRQVRNERRQHEWRVTLGLWLTLAAGIVAAKDLPSMSIWYIRGLLTAILLCHFWWVLENYTRHNRDINKAYKHLRKAEPLSHPSLVLAYDPNDPVLQRKPYQKVPLFEILGTILLCAAFYIVYSHSSHDIAGFGPG
jgi:hypothetical protein